MRRSLSSCRSHIGVAPNIIYMRACVCVPLANICLCAFVCSRGEYHACVRLCAPVENIIGVRACVYSFGGYCVCVCVLLFVTVDNIMCLRACICVFFWRISCVCVRIIL